MRIARVSVEVRRSGGSFEIVDVNGGGGGGVAGDLADARL
jgi:hypothetical protein